MDSKIKNKGQGRIFKSPFLEIFTKTSPTITLVVFVPVLVFFLVMSEGRTGLSLFASILVYLAGFVFWTFFEYMAHRYLFHWVADSKIGKRIHYIIHGVHHEFPRDDQRVFMPPLPGLIIVALLFGIFYLMMGNFVYLFLPGMMTGWLIYVFIHYSIHCLKPPKFLKFLWTHHNLHHYKDQSKSFGVSSTFWDHVFGTMPDKETAEH